MRTYNSKKYNIYIYIMSAVFVGFILLNLYLSNALSYLSERPETCVNCHVMKTHYVSWSKSAHRANASCVECHLPQDNFIKKYIFKAKDGFRHSYVFALKLESQNIRIKEDGKKVVQENCIRCHINQLQNISLSKMTLNENHYCWNCHRETPHGRATSLSSSPNAFMPSFIIPTPTWIANYITIENNNSKKEQ